MAKIEIQDLRYSIGGREILQGISVDISPREILCVVGLSGGGKSTLIRCVSGLVSPDSGAIRIDGTDISHLKEEELLEIRAKMGVVFQYAALFDSMTVYENIAFGLTRGPRRVENKKIGKTVLIRRVAELLHEVGLPGIEKRMPDELSGGMRRRVGLARALATSPEIVLYDEPTSGLDPVTAASIDALIVEMRDSKNVTSIIVSHDMQSVFRIADRVLFLYEGKAHFLGTPQIMQKSTDAIIHQFINGHADGPIRQRKR